MDVRFITNIIKEYPDMFKIMIYKEPMAFVHSGAVKRTKYLIDPDNYIPSISSLSRTKTLIRDIIVSNDFDLFCTFTFDPDKVDRYSYSACRAKISTWFHHQIDRDSAFKYLVVPERHKDGAWHFHALLAHFHGQMRDSHHKSSTGRPVYNITSYRSGFSTAVPIDSREGVAEYVSKYITKDFIKDFNQRRFFCSRNLTRPTKIVNGCLRSFRAFPLFYNRTGETQDAVFYTFRKF